MTHEPNMRDSGERRTFPTGAVRDRGETKPRPDLVSPHANMREGAWLALGAKKYAPRNWEKGMPISECVASLNRHLVAYIQGLQDEDHMAAVRTNAGFILHYEEEIKAGRLPASLDDMPHYATSDSLAQRFPTVELVSGNAATPLEAKVQARLDATFPIDDNPNREASVTSLEDYVERGGDPNDAVGMMLGHYGSLGKLPRKPQPVSIFTVYLCGPITGQPVDNLWRDAATAFLKAHGIKTLNPLRGKKPEDISHLGLGYKGQLAAPEIAERDRMDIEESDVVLAHFPYEPPRQSIGSLMEMGAAAIGFKKPVILCTTVQVFADHLFCRNFCTLEPNFEQALHRIVAIATAKQR
jgi:nucleoside 2-deoxyribosyltransferase